MSIKRNFLYNTTYQILNILIPLITTPYVSRVLGAEGVGRYSFAYSVSTYFVIFSLLGVNNYGNRSIAKARDNSELLNLTFSSIYVLQLLMTIAVSIIYLFYIVFLCDDKSMGLIMMLYVVSPLVDLNWLFSGLEKFKVIALRGIFIRILGMILIFTLVKTKNDVYKYAFIHSASIILSYFILWAQAKRYVRFVRVKPSDVIKHLLPNITLFIPVIAINLYKYMDKIMLGTMANKLEVGYYESCDKVLAVPVAIVNSLGMVMLPRISNLVAHKNTSATIGYLKKSLIVASSLSSSISLGIMAVAEQFVPMYYGPGFEQCISIFIVIMPSCIFVAIANVIRTQYLIPYGMDKEYTTSVIIGAIINLIINALLIPGYGAIGAAVGTLAAECSVFVIQTLYVKKRIDPVIIVSNCLPYIGSAVFMYFLLMRLTIKTESSLVLMIIKIIIGACIYSIMWIIIMKMRKMVNNIHEHAHMKP